MVLLMHPDDMAPGFLHREYPKRLSQKLGLRVYNLVLGITHHHFCSILLPHSSAPISVCGGEDYIRARIPGGEDHWGHFGGWLPQAR